MNHSHPSIQAAATADLATQPTSRKLRTLLRPRHFCGVYATIYRGSLVYSRVIDRQTRLNHLIVRDDAENLAARIEPLLDQQRSFVFAGSALRGMLPHEQLESMTLPEERSRFNLENVQQRLAHAHWSLYEINGGSHGNYDWNLPGQYFMEGQTVTLGTVREDPPTFPGFVQLDFGVGWGTHCREIDITIEAELILVAADHRGTGVGMDLSIACGDLCAELLRATYRAARSNVNCITTTLIADIASPGGRRVVDQIAGEFEAAREDLVCVGDKPRLHVEPLTIDERDLALEQRLYEAMAAQQRLDQQAAEAA